MEIKNIAKLSSYGAYIDEEFIYTNSIVEGKNVIVGNIAEYMYDLEQEIAKKESDTAREIIEWIKRNGTFGYGGYVIHDSTIEQIGKKYGVDLGD